MEENMEGENDNQTPESSNKVSTFDWGRVNIPGIFRDAIDACKDEHAHTFLQLPKELQLDAIDCLFEKYEEDKECIEDYNVAQLSRNIKWWKLNFNYYYNHDKK